MTRYNIYRRKAEIVLFHSEREQNRSVKVDEKLSQNGTIT